MHSNLRSAAGHSQQGFLISLEGIDGSGKSSLAQRLSTFFVQELFSVFVTKEPGGTVLGSYMRSLLQEQAIPLAPIAEFLLFAADRAQHIHQVVGPHLAAGSLVISDRMADSSLVYQGCGLGLDITMLGLINAWAMQGVEPHVTLYVRIDYQTAWERCAQRGERLTAFEKRGKDFGERLIAGYDALAQNSLRIKIIDGAQHPEQVFKQAVALVYPLVRAYYGF